jgi:hypothetical protein
MGFMMQLLERPEREQLKTPLTMTPERWPDIDISSQVFLSHFSEPNEMELNTSLSLKSPEEMKELYWPRDKTDALDTLDGLLEAGVSGRRQNVQENIERISGILRNATKFGNERAPKTVRHMAYMTEISFGDLQSKTISTVLSKVFSSLQPTDKVKDLDAVDTVTASENQEVIEMKEEPEAVAQSSHSPIICRPDRRLVLTGADLHLLDYDQLKRLAVVNEIEIKKDSRGAIERALCKHFVSLSNDPDVEHLQRLKNVDFVKPKVGDKEFIWTEGLDEELVRHTETVRDARRDICAMVEVYLTDKCRLPPSSNEDTLRDMNLWKVVANELGASPKSCKKRWLLLHRMKCMAGEQYSS